MIGRWWRLLVSGQPIRADIQAQPQDAEKWWAETADGLACAEEQAEVLEAFGPRRRFNLSSPVSAQEPSAGDTARPAATPSHGGAGQPQLFACPHCGKPLICTNP